MQYVPVPALVMMRLAVWLAALVLALPVLAFEPGARAMTVPQAGADAPAVPLMLYYPTQTPARTMAMGPLKVHVAIGAPPEPTVKGLIVLSHGTGGSELAHSTLAEGLAAGGYLVAALRHPGDNWQDTSLLKKDPARYFDQRPRQASRIIDALLADPQWRDRIPRDERGPRIGAVGHSAGGYTVLALVGAEADLARLDRHCAAQRELDPIFCRQGGPDRTALPPAATPLRDPRVRAAVALSPAAAMLTAESLARITAPVAIYVAQLDRFLVPRFHGEWVAQNLPAAEMHRVANAWHFAFLDAPTVAIPTDDGDLGADPAGFDRAAFLKQLAAELPAFFDRTLAAP